MNFISNILEELPTIYLSSKSLLTFHTNFNMGILLSLLVNYYIPALPRASCILLSKLFSHALFLAAAVALLRS